MQDTEKQHFKREAIKILRPLGFSISFNSKQTCVDLEINKVFFNMSVMKNLSMAWSALLHEMGHIYCYINNIYPKYHNYEINTIKEAFAFNALALKAEVYVDMWAEDLYNEMGFKKKFKKKYNRTYYFDQDSKDFVKQYNKKLLRLVIGDIYDYNKKNI